MGCDGCDDAIELFHAKSGTLRDNGVLLEGGCELGFPCRFFEITAQ
jgi:hypothetical protein